MNAWNKDDMCSTEALDCSANPPKITCKEKSQTFCNSYFQYYELFK